MPARWARMTKGQYNIRVGRYAVQLDRLKRARKTIKTRAGRIENSRQINAVMTRLKRLADWEKAKKNREKAGIDRNELEMLRAVFRERRGNK
jgi:hypothetical protein